MLGNDVPLLVKLSTPVLARDSITTAEPEKEPIPVKLILPKAVTVIPVLKVGVFVAPANEMSRPNLGISAVIVCPADIVENATSSCGSGTRPDHAFVDQFPPDVPFHVWVVDGVKVRVEPPPVIELPPQSPDRPVIADKSTLDADENVMSRKSALENDVVALVIVLAVPSTSDKTKSLLIDEFPEIVLPFIFNVAITWS